MELYIRICGADMRGYMLLQVNGALYHSLFMYIYWARKHVLKEV